MDDIDDEIVVAQRLEATKAANIAGVIADAEGFEHKPEGHVQTAPAVIGKIDITKVKKKAKKPEKEVEIVEEKQTYAEKIAEIEKAYS